MQTNKLDDLCDVCSYDLSVLFLEHPVHIYIYDANLHDYLLLRNLLIDSHHLIMNRAWGLTRRPNQ